jgi:hypothetical protein
MIGAKEYSSVYVGGGQYEPKLTLTEPALKDGWQVGAYEPTTGIHSDVEFVYTLDLVKLTIAVQERIGDEKFRTLDTIKDFSDKPLQPEPAEDPEALEII